LDTELRVTRAAQHKIPIASEILDYFKVVAMIGDVELTCTRSTEKENTHIYNLYGTVPNIPGEYVMQISLLPKLPGKSLFDPICLSQKLNVMEPIDDSDSSSSDEPSSNTTGKKTASTKSKKRIRGNKGGRKQKRAKVNRIAVKEKISSGANVRAETSDSEEEMEITPTVLEPQVRASNEETIVQENNEEQATPKLTIGLVQVFKKELEGSENDSLDNILNSKLGVFNDHFVKYFDMKKQTK
jgi:hypothetical protein